MPICQFCDEEITPGAKNCPSCGAEVSPVERVAEAADLERELIGLIDRGMTLEAIKRYRDVTGAGLAEAKTAIDELKASRSLPPRTSTQPRAVESGLELAVLEVMRQGRKIEAIKLYRERTGAGLKQAKEAVDALAAEHGIADKGGGCLAVLLLVMGTGVLATFLIT